MTTNATSPTTLREEAARHEQAAADSFDRCDTDGFLSQWASGITAQLKRREADVLEAGGVHEFACLTDLDGNWVPSKLIDGRYGLCWALLAEDGTFTGTFVSAFPKRAATLERKGYREGRGTWPAKAKIVGSGTGLSGAASCYVSVVRAYPEGVTDLTPPSEITFAAD